MGRARRSGGNHGPSAPSRCVRYVTRLKDSHRDTCGSRSRGGHVVTNVRHPGRRSSYYYGGQDHYPFPARWAGAVTFRQHDHFPPYLHRTSLTRVRHRLGVVHHTRAAEGKRLKYLSSLSCWFSEADAGHHGHLHCQRSQAHAAVGRTHIWPAPPDHGHDLVPGPSREPTVGVTVPQFDVRTPLCGRRL